MIHLKNTVLQIKIFINKDISKNLNWEGLTLHLPPCIHIPRICPLNGEEIASWGKL